MYRLANVIFPTPNVCMDSNLYYKTNEAAWYCYDRGKLIIKKGSTVTFDTYFNSFSIGKWRKFTVVEDLKLVLDISGKVRCKLIHFRSIYSKENLGEFIIGGKGPEEIEVDTLYDDGILYFVLEALEDSEVKEVYWGTNTPPVNRIRLGISITTFNRQQAVHNSSRRILNFLHEVKDVNAHLVVVDNGKNLELSQDPFLTLIPNENLGGSGGFARGLFYFKQEAEAFTHCLFMDDDAACETESIFRTYKLFSYSNDEKLAIAGAMLMADEPNIQWENGARFKYHSRPLKRGYNLHDLSSVVNNEIEEGFDYGAWWYFAFPIKYAEYPYPFFVRGDDVDFGLRRQFHTITINGVATWGDDFSYKESPLTLYLDTRSHLLHHLQSKKIDNSFFACINVLWRPIIRYTMTYKYSSAEAHFEAIRDVLKGPGFWAENIDMKNVFPRISPLSNEEKMKKMDLARECEDFLLPDQQRLTGLHYIIKFVKIFTLNGHLVPEIFFKRKNVIIEKTDHRFGLFFLRKQICLYHSKTREGVLLKHNKKRFFKILFEGVKISVNLYRKHEELKSEYAKVYPYLTSKEFWQEKFNIHE